jgi:hypothetical protein
VTLKVLLAGEGRNELGGWYDHATYRDTTRPGVLEALLRRVQPDGWEIIAAIPWKNIKKFRVGGSQNAEMRNVLGLMLMAAESKCDVVVFSRDLDDDEERADSIEKGLNRAASEFRDGPQVIGGIAIRKLESWLVALAGRTCSQDTREAQIEEIFSDLGIKLKDTAAMVRMVEEADLSRIPKDAQSLHDWLDKARRVLQVQ